MSRLCLIATVALASYTVLSTLVAALVVAAWHAGLAVRGHPSAAARANLLLQLRLMPSAVALFLTLGLVLPAYLAFEPPLPFESVGPLLLWSAGLGAVLWGVALATAARSLLATRRLERQWLRSADRLAVDPPIGVPSFAIESPAPLIALVGVWRPKLVAARSVARACGRDELASIVRHEMGHLRARDNMKRLLIACAPDLLRVTPVHGRIAAAWRHAAEDAADDAATLGEPRARVELAALLVKVARLSVQPVWTAAAVSPFVDADEVDRRVRRLLRDDSLPQRSAWSVVAPGLSCGLAAAVVLCLASPAALSMLYAGVEALVAAGR